MTDENCELRLLREDSEEREIIIIVRTILDRLFAELTRRGECYTLLSKKFKVLESLLDEEIPTSTLIKEAENLKTAYVKDLDDGFVSECIHFRDYLKTHEFCDDGRSKILQMFTLIHAKSLDR